MYKGIHRETNRRRKVAISNEKYDDKNYFNACIAVVFYHCIFALQKI